MANLKRSLGLFPTTLLSVGVILGAGIYALVGKAAGLAGDAVWISFLAAAMVASPTGLSYAELSAMIPRAGGEYHYARRAFGRAAGFAVAWLLLTGIAIASAAVALGFGGYLEATSGLPASAGAVLSLLASAALLSFGMRESAWAASICTLIEVFGLLVIMAVGLPHLGEVDVFAMPNGWDGVGSAAVLIFFAYIGFEEIVQLAEETHDPTRNVPRALILSILITTVLYVAVALAAISVLGAEALAASKAPLADVAALALGGRAFSLMAGIALLSTANTVLILLMSAARLLYGMAEDGSLPRRLAAVHPGRSTPIVATATVTCVAAAIVLAFDDIEAVASLTNVTLLLTFVVINGAVIALRRLEPDTPRPWRIPGALAGVPVVPVLGAASALVMLAGTERATLAWLGALLALGLVAFRFGRWAPTPDATP